MSGEPWNIEDKFAPPTCSVNTVARRTDILEMMNVINSALTSLQHFKNFKAERTLFSLFLYKYKRVFRHERGVKLMTQVNQALMKDRTQEMIKAMEKMKICFPTTISPEREEYYLPTQQMLKWLLLRIMGNAKIFKRLMQLCQESISFISSRVATERRSDCMLLASALISRVYACSKYYLMKVTEWYNKLRTFLPILIDTVDFLKNYEFPKTMEDFIGPVDMNPRGYRPNVEEVFELIDLTHDDDNEGEDVLFDCQSDSDKETDTGESIPKKRRIGNHLDGKADSETDVVVLYENLTNESKISTKTSACLEDLGEPVLRELKQDKKED